MARITISGLTDEEKQRIKAACSGKGQYVKDIGRLLFLSFTERWENETREKAEEDTP